MGRSDRLGGLAFGTHLNRPSLDIQLAMGLVAIEPFTIHRCADCNARFAPRSHNLPPYAPASRQRLRY